LDRNVKHTGSRHPVITRKSFFRHLIARAIEAMEDPTLRDACGHGRAGPDTDPISLELCPSLLALEAECRGIDLQAGGAGELQRMIYRELGGTPGSEPGTSPPEAG
jgi:hypothetical protein